MQILVIILIILLLFGASRLGEVGKGLGEGIRNFKKSVSGDDEKPSEGGEKRLEEAKSAEPTTKSSDATTEPAPAKEADPKSAGSTGGESAKDEQKA